MYRCKLTFLLIAWGAVLGGCVGPAPGTPVGEVEASGQACSICVLENPGDVAPCEGICREHEADQAGFWAGAALR
jgi:hypothetical protein